MKYILLALSTIFLFAPELAIAADLTDSTDHLRDQIDSAKEFALAVAFMIGLFLFIGGLYGLYKDSKQPGQDHAKKGAYALGIGTLLLIVPTVIAIAGGTFGDDENAAKSVHYDSGY